MLRSGIHNLSTAVPQALGEMLDSVQTESTQAEGEVSSSASAVSTPLERPSTSPSMPSLVKKEILNAALAYLESTEEGRPQEMPAESVPNAPFSEALIPPQKVNPEPLPAAPESMAENADPRTVLPDAPALPPRQPDANRGKRTLAFPVPLVEDLPEQPTQSALPVQGRLFESPARLMAALVADEEREIMSARFQYADGKVRQQPENTPRSPSSEKQSAEEKPGTSLLTLTQKLLKLVSEERQLPANVTPEQRHPTTEQEGIVQGKTFFWHKRDKQPGAQALEEWADAPGIGDKNDERNGPTWHPFPPATADSPEQASAGLLAAVVVSLLATLLVIILLVLNL